MGHARATLPFDSRLNMPPARLYVSWFRVALALACGLTAWWFGA